MTKRAAIYLRISLDHEGDGAGVRRQAEDCEALAAQRGFDVVATYTDNSVSAYSGKRRPDFERMMAAVAAGEFDVIVAWASDRLYRRLSDLERLVDELGRVQVATVKSGEVDLTTADGRMLARMLGSVSQHSSEKSAERIRRAKVQSATAGKPHNGTRRFGYTADMTALVPVEAEALAAAYATIADGGSLRAIAASWTAAGLTGTTGARITSRSVREGLLRSVNGGLITHRGREVGASIAPTIVDADTFRRVRAILANPARATGPGRAPQHLLTGVLRCAPCQAAGLPSKMSVAKRSGDKARVYRCRTCYQSRDHARLNEAITGLTLAWLTEHRAVLLRPSTTPMVDKAAQEAETLRTRLEGLADLAASGDLDPVDYAAAAKGVRERLTVAEAKIVKSSPTPAAAAMAAAEDIPAAWEAATDDQRRATVADIFERIEVAPARRGRFTMDGITPVRR